jgi:predicted CXXCH cytochrome family protein
MNETHKRWAVSVLLAGCVVVMFVACTTLERQIIAPPDIPGAKFVGNQTCYDCHTNYVRAFSFSPHARIHTPTSQVPGNSGCESCHGPGSLHVASGGGRGQLIVNPGRDSQACFNCHLETHAQFNLPQHHPVREGKMNCVQCHDPHGFDIMKPARGLAMSRVNESCAECHREQTRQTVFRHEALREGCTTCHQPHGSVNNKMLVQPDSNLCLRCHAQVADRGRPGRVVIGKKDHTAYMNRGSCWTSTCHTAVHGSTIDPYLRY